MKNTIWNRRMKRILFICFQRMPDWFRHIASRLINRPVLGKGVIINGFVVFGEKVCLGDYSYLNHHSRISWMKTGRYVRMGKNLTVIPSSREYEKFSNYNFMQGLNSPMPYDKEKARYENYGDYRCCVIGNDVWIGENVTIIGAVKIGDGAVIGAGSVVKRDVPPFAIVGGNPASLIRYRFDSETRDKLEALGWWDWPPQKVEANYWRLCALTKSGGGENDSLWKNFQGHRAESGRLSTNSMDTF